MRLSLKDVSAGYGKNIVLHDISVDIDEGLTVVLGPNGAGKTTLFRVICGVLKPIKGSVSIDGVKLDEYDRSRLISYMPHGNALIRNLTVKEYLSFWSRIHGLNSKEYNRVRELLKVLELEECLNKKVDELSHGQKRKLALIRTLMTNAKIFLFDEPTSGLDIYSASAIHNIVKNVAKNAIVLHSTHNLYEALKLANRILVLYKGRIVFYGSIDEVQKLVSIRNVKIKILNLDRKRQEVVRLRDLLKRNVSICENYIMVKVSNEEEIAFVVRQLVAIGLDVVEVRFEGNPLEMLIQELIRR